MDYIPNLNLDMLKWEFLKVTNDSVKLCYHSAEAYEN